MSTQSGREDDKRLVVCQYCGYRFVLLPRRLARCPECGKVSRGIGSPRRQLRDIHFDLVVSVVGTAVWIVVVGMIALSAQLIGYSTMARTLVGFLTFFALATPVIWIAVQIREQSRGARVGTITIPQFIARIVVCLVLTWVPSLVLVAVVRALLI